MIYQDGINFVEDVETFQYYPFSTTEDLSLVESMSGHGKQQHLDLYGINLHQNTGSHLLPTHYESPGTHQSDLAALPGGYGGEFDDSYAYGSNRAEDYSHVNFSSSALTTNVAAPMPLTQMSKKRKTSVESFPSEAPAPKRMALQDPSGEYYDLKSESSPYSSFVPTPTALPAGQISYSLGCSPRLMGHQHSTSNTSQVSVAPTAPYTPTVSPSFTTANTEHSPRAPPTPGARPASVASNPRLVRTSTMPQTSPQAMASNMTLVGHTQNFNPYTLYSPDSKARLHLDGNLDDVAKNWSDEEIEARRKIVVFNREQKGNDIYASFDVVSQAEWKNHPRSVSCIWWAEKKEAYVTSVDTILLLEGIVAARFTVEEKNRIRRNLEGFKPDTVSKAKPDTEEFFKSIMGFPNPKPRNIEKDVKVFPWRILSIALQKIISKYSASYASTAASIQNQPKMYRPMEQADYTYSTSPAPEYRGNLQLANFPMYEQHGRYPAPVAPVPHMHMAPLMGQNQDPHAAAYGYAHIQMPQHNHMHYQSQAMSTPATAPMPYWPQPTYATEGAVSMAPASAPATAYPREMMESAEYHRSVAMNHFIHAGHR